MSFNIQRIAERIKYLREQSNLSQQSLAELLGVSRSTVSYIETGERKITADELLKLSEIFKLTLDELLNVNSSSKEKQALRAKKSIIENQENKKLRFKKLFIYILNRIGAKHNVGETVLYKILYYVDFDYYYEKGRKKLIGLTYMKNNFGPTPNDFKKLVDEMISDGDLIKIKSKHFEFDQVKYLPLIKPDVSIFTGEELQFIDKIIEKHSDKSAKQLSDESHKDPPWRDAVFGSVIDYNDVFKRDMLKNMQDN